MFSRRLSLGLIVLASFVAGGCQNAPPPDGFLSSYKNLKNVGDDDMRYVSPKLREYESFTVAPVVIHVNSSAEPLTPRQQAEVTGYFRESLINALTKGGFKVTNHSGTGVGRIRIAITDVKETAWWAKTHDAGKNEGAAMEGEIRDSLSGFQIVAFIQGDTRKQFLLKPFTTIDEVQPAIDQWTQAAVKRLQELQQHDAAQEDLSK